MYSCNLCWSVCAEGGEEGREDRWRDRQRLRGESSIESINRQRVHRVDEILSNTNRLRLVLTKTDLVHIPSFELNQLPLLTVDSNK